MSPTSSTTTSGTGSQASAASSTTAQPGTVDENMFLQLLVAQLQNQDPLNPPDGTQFVTQLAQFQQLEQSINTGSDISSILSDINTYMGISSSGTTTSTTDSGSTPQS
jgi:flagellar basal-body rod modification protein FlgD